MLVPEHIINQISLKNNIIDLVGEYVQLTKKGTRYWGLCPFHSEKTPSFCVTPEKQVFYCFGCQKGGSIYTFIMEIEKLPFTEAVHFLAKRAGIALENLMDSRKHLQNAIKRDAFIELYKKITNSFHHLLKHSEKAIHARSYLEKRGIQSSLLDTFQLGYAPKARDWLYSFLLNKNYSKDFLKTCGLFSKGQYSYFYDRIIFPIYNVKNEILAFGGRILSDLGPKYLNSPETAYFHKGDNLYGIHLALPQIKQQGSFILVEGYMDVLALFQADITNCIAPLGTALTEQQAKLLKRYADKGYLFFDSDEAGMNATLRAIEILENNDIQVEVFELPFGKDPAELLKEKNYLTTLQKVLKFPINSFQYIIKKAISLFDIETPHGKERIFNYIFPYIRRIKSQVKQYGYIEMLTDTLRVDKDAVWADFIQGKSYNLNIQKSSKTNAKEKISIELFLMLGVSIFRSFFPKVRNMLSIDDLEDETARKLYISLEECYRNEEESVDALLEKIDDPNIKELFLKKISSEEYMFNQDRLIQDSIIRIKQKSLEKKRDLIVKQLKDHEKNEGNPLSIRELEVEKMFLDDELKKIKVM